MVAIQDNFDDEAGVDLPRKSRDDSEMDITPMIDITFLLLIFFLVASKMDAEQAVRLPEAGGMPVSSKNAVVVLIKRVDADTVQVLQKDGTAFSDDKDTQEEEITKYVQDGLDGVPPFTAKKEHILIKAEKGIKHKEVHRVERAIGRAQISEEVSVETVFIAVKQKN